MGIQESVDYRRSRSNLCRTGGRWRIVKEQNVFLARRAYSSRPTRRAVQTHAITDLVYRVFFSVRFALTAHSSGSRSSHIFQVSTDRPGTFQISSPSSQIAGSYLPKAAALQGQGAADRSGETGVARFASSLHNWIKNISGRGIFSTSFCNQIAIKNCRLL